MKRSYLMWTKTRWAILAAVGLAVVVLGGLALRELAIRKEVRETVSRALVEESVGGVDEIRSAKEGVASLIAKRGDRSIAVESAAWLDVVDALLFGREAELGARAAESLSLVDGGEGPLGAAARAGVALLAGKPDAALAFVAEASKEYPSEPRLSLVRGLALDAQGQHEAAIRYLAKSSAAYPTYFPLAAAGLEIAVRTDDIDDGRKLLSVVESSGSAKRLLASLAHVSFSFGAWGDDRPGEVALTAVSKEMAKLRAEIRSAPPRLLAVGKYVEGRLHLAQARPEDAAESLSSCSRGHPTESAVAWRGLALLESGDPDAVLALLDSHKELGGSALLDLRARALLACDRVESAKPVIERLKSTGALPTRVAKLELSLAVKSGDGDGALAKLPETMGAGDAALALELFFLLDEEGNTKGISRLVKAFGEELGSCARMMRGWQKRDPRPVLRELDSKATDPCAFALAGTLLRGRTAPEKLGVAFDRAASAVRASAQLQVAKALAVHLVEGRDAALAILDRIFQKKPEAAPLKRALGRAYLRLGNPKKALEIVGGLEDPEALEVRYLAARELKEGVSEIVDLAESLNRSRPHPVFAWIAAHARFANGEYRIAAETAEAVLPSAGRFTAELAEIAARTVNMMGDRSDADEILAEASRALQGGYGLDEMWEVRIAYARLNLFRGGKFVRKAVSELRDLTQVGALDARIPLNQGILAMRRGYQDEAIQAFQKALSMDPSLDTAYGNLAKLGALDGDLAARMRKVLPDFEP